MLAVAQLLGDDGRIFSNEKCCTTPWVSTPSFACNIPTAALAFPPKSPTAKSRRVQALNAMHHAEAPRSPSPSRAQRNAVLAAAIDSQQSHSEPAMTPPAIQPQQVRPPSRPPPAMTPPPIQPTQLAPSSTRTARGPTRCARSAAPRRSLAGQWNPPLVHPRLHPHRHRSPRPGGLPGGPRARSGSIYFDLYGSRLGPGLNGKSVEVIDDGFLKRIRAAQFSNNVTRIVLDVSSVSDYSAFLLPNPWRLIIDIHGLKTGTTPTTNLASLPPSTQPAVRQPVPYPASKPPVVNTPQPAAVASAAAGAHSGTQEIAALGQQPNRVQATDRPTTHPIAASVAGTVPAPQPDDSLAAAAASTTPPPPASSHSRKKPSPIHPPPPDTPDADDTPSAPSHEAEPTAAGERSLVRTLGLKIGPHCDRCRPRRT